MCHPHACSRRPHLAKRRRHCGAQGRTPEGPTPTACRPRPGCGGEFRSERDAGERSDNVQTNAAQPQPLLGVRKLIVKTKWWIYCRGLADGHSSDRQLFAERRFDKTFPRGVHVGEKSYVAFDVSILTHDMTRGLYLHTRIGRHCFIGARSIIMPGIQIGDGSIVGRAASSPRTCRPLDRCRKSRPHHPQRHRGGPLRAVPERERHRQRAVGGRGSPRAGGEGTGGSDLVVIVRGLDRGLRQAQPPRFTKPAFAAFL